MARLEDLNQQSELQGMENIILREAGSMQELENRKKCYETLSSGCDNASPFITHLFTFPRTAQDQATQNSGTYGEGAVQIAHPH